MPAFKDVSYLDDNGFNKWYCGDVDFFVVVD